ncbi:MAG: helix-turn-helix transcriptional regulator [Alphaproteobacteria bacterium]|nr:helix-turn-helix transcriptional regulator [Alphaproteobacteria bacterium]
MYTTKSNKPVRHRSTEIDKSVGERMRMRRLLLHLSQRQIADKLGLTFQQVQKYEKGISCISAGRLWQLSEILKVPLYYFFKDAAEHRAEKIPAAYKDPMSDTETIRLVHNYYKLSNRRLAGQIFDLLDRIANPRKE